MERKIIARLRSPPILLGLAQLPPGAAPVHDLGGTKAAKCYEVEENLGDAIGLNAIFVAIGDRLASYGAAKITVKEEDWQKTFSQLASASQLIFMMPGPSASALWGAVADHAFA